MLKDFIKFSVAAIGSMLLGSHLVYSYYQPMSVTIISLIKLFS